MKNNKIIGLIFLVVFSAGLSANIFGQKKQISSGEFYSAYSDASNKQYELSRRVEEISETFADGNVTKSAVEISEILLPNKRRDVYKEKIGDLVRETESITIDNFQYTRENGGVWTKIDLSKRGSGSGIGSGTGRAVSCRQITVEPTFLGNYSAQLFEDLTIDSGARGLKYNETRHWISSEGLLLKSEESEGLLTPRVETSKTVTTIEYNPSIKIEAPIK